MGRLARFIHFYTDEDEGGKPTPTPEVWKTASGSIVSFVTSVAYPMRKLLAQINPVQDLHGQTSPYPAGGGPNQWDEQWEGGDISAETGINEGNAQMIRTVGYIPVDANKTYYFFCGSISSTNARARFYDQNKSYIGYSPAGGTFVQVNESFTPPSGAYYMRFAMQPVYGTTYKNDISVNYPSTVTTYSPYSNECPISGWTGLSGKRTGSNQWDEQWEAGGINTDGQKNGDTTRIRSKNYIPVIGGATYYTNTRIAYFEYDANQTFLRAGNNGSFLGPDVTLTISPDAHFILFMCIKDYGTVYKNDIAINLPSTYTAYEPYITPTTITCTWQSEAGTVYGGTVDVVTGVLTGGWKIVDLATLTWTATSWGGWRTGSISDLKIISTDTNANLVAEKYKAVSQRDVPSTENAIATGTFNTPQRLYANCKDAPTGMCVYPLTDEASQTYQLTPQQIETLLGNNTVFVDTGDVEVTYRES